MWDKEAIKRRLGDVLEFIELDESQLPVDSSGNTIPACLVLLFIAEQINSGDFFGSIGVKVKGKTVLKPEVLNQTFRMPLYYENFLND